MNTATPQRPPISPTRITRPSAGETMPGRLAARSRKNQARKREDPGRYQGRQIGNEQGREEPERGERSVSAKSG